MKTEETIAALATAPLPAGVAVIRVSGPKALEKVRGLCPKLKDVQPRQAHFTPLMGGEGERLDEALLIHFPAPNSFTGEEVVELHTHGGRAVVQSVLGALFALGVRQAEAGEFTKRAVLNGKMDLTEAEGLADLIAAETEAQQKQALRQLGGELGKLFEGWRTEILALLAQVEAGIDFPDEELDILEDSGLERRLKALKVAFEKALAQNAGERLRDGFRLAIVGRPNAGKSTLTNLLTGRETAIVSPIAGTTRDVVEAPLDIGGYPVVLADTAGLRETDDVIEAEGVRRAEKEVQEADFVIQVVAADEGAPAPLDRPADMVVVSKTDLATAERLADVAVNLLEGETALEAILMRLTKKIEGQLGAAQSAAHITQARHREALQEALAHLEKASALWRARAENTLSLSDLLAQDLREAAACIGRVTGAVSSEDVLDVVFSTFCIGK